MSTDLTTYGSVLFTTMLNKLELNLMKTLDAAMAYKHEYLYSVIPVEGKRPAIKWNDYRERYATDEELKDWFTNTCFGIAAVCGPLSNLTVLDADKPEAEVWIVQNANTEEIVRTPSGGAHYHFDYIEYPNKVNMFGIGLDVRSDGGLICLPPTPNYKWIKSGARGRLTDVLPEIITANVADHSDVITTGGDVVQRTISYLQKLPPAISGQGGHKRAFRAACVIADRLSQTMLPEQALPIMEEWNQKCEPPWSTAELLHKLQDAWSR